MTQLKLSIIPTPLGPMQAIADDSALYALHFFDQELKNPAMNKLEKMYGSIAPGRSDLYDQLELQLYLYFTQRLKEFSIPLQLSGTPFQHSVWHALQNIPYGTTHSYAQLAQTIEKPTGYRAVAQANSCNMIAIIIPCHRVINTSGNLGGYNAGLDRKQWLLEHEAA